MNVSPEWVDALPRTERIAWYLRSYREVLEDRAGFAASKEVEAEIIARVKDRCPSEWDTSLLF